MRKLRPRDSGEASGAETGSGAWLAAARRESGLSQRALAKRLGVRRRLVDDWEAGRKGIAAEQLEQLAAALGAPPEAAPLSATGSREPPPAEPGPPAAATPGSAASLSAEARSPWTAARIRNSELPRSRRGYDESATRRLLDEIASSYMGMVGELDRLEQRVRELDATLESRQDYEHVARERDRLRQRIEELEAALEDRESSEQMLSKALVAASRAGDELLSDARAEAESVVAEAKRSAEQTAREGEERLRTLERRRDELLHELRWEALTAAQQQLAAVQREGEKVASALAGLSGQIVALGQLEVREPPRPEPSAVELVGDLLPQPHREGDEPAGGG